MERIVSTHSAKSYKLNNDELSNRYDSLGTDCTFRVVNDYVNGKSFCCDNNDIEVFNRPDTESGNSEDAGIFFYHPDHLGSTAMVTDHEGRITQNVVYIPFGEVFVEQRDGNWNTPYLFNAKELDEETGLYYYGARYLDPTAAQWLSVDPLFEKYAGMSPYNYCAGNPVVMVDLDGREPGGVRIILQLGGDPDIRDAARTRINEIKEKYPNDKLVIIKKCFFDKLKERIESEIAIASKEGYKKTKELAVFSHNGSDGPIYNFSDGYNGDLRLSNYTHSLLDDNQMTIDGWAGINYNFDSKNSIAVFYGCQSASFAKKFLENTNVQSAAGNPGRAGGTYSVTGDFNSTWLNKIKNVSDPIYLRAEQSGKVLPMYLYKRGYFELNYDNSKDLKEFNIYENPTVQ